MASETPSLIKKLLFRYDGTADSAKVSFTSAKGTEWQAELSLHSGTDPQAPRLMVIFRRPRYPGVPQRYTLLPPRFSKVPKDAAGQITGDDLRELLAESVQV